MMQTTRHNFKTTRRNGTRIVQWLGWLLLLPLFAACSLSEDVEIAPTPDDEAMGTLEIALTRAATRATTTVITKEEADNFLVTIFKGSDVVRETVRLKDLNSSLSAGYGYTVKAENCSDAEAESANEGWGQRHFAGTSASFAIKAGQTTKVDVGCSVVNAGMEVVFYEAFISNYTTYSLTIVDGDRTIVFDSETGGYSDGNNIREGRTAYFNVGADETRTVTYHIEATGTTNVSQTGTMTLTKAKKSRINLKPSDEIGHFGVEVTIDDTFSLDAEDVIVDLD